MNTQIIKELIDLTAEKEYRAVIVIEKYMRKSSEFYRETKLIADHFNGENSDTEEAHIDETFMSHYNRRIKTADILFQKLKITDAVSYRLLKQLIKHINWIDSNGWRVKDKGTASLKKHFLNKISQVDLELIEYNHPEYLI